MMKCEMCMSKNIKCIDSRPPSNDVLRYVKRRRYKCLDCGERFTTYEIMADDYNERKTEKDKMIDRSVVKAMLDMITEVYNEQ